MAYIVFFNRGPSIVAIYRYITNGAIVDVYINGEYISISLIISKERQIYSAL